MLYSILVHIHSDLRWDRISIVTAVNLRPQVAFFHVLPFKQHNHKPSALVAIGCRFQFCVTGSA